MLVSDDVIMGEWVFTDTHDSELNDIPPTEREMELKGMDTILIVDGKVQEHQVYYNLYGMFEQFGPRRLRMCDGSILRILRLTSTGQRAGRSSVLNRRCAPSPTQSEEGVSYFTPVERTLSGAPLTP